MQKNETRPLPYVIHIINSKWIKELNIRLEKVKLLQESIGKKLLDISLGSDIFDTTAKAQEQKQK